LKYIKIIFSSRRNLLEIVKKYNTYRLIFNQSVIFLSLPSSCNAILLKNIEFFISHSEIPD